MRCEGEDLSFGEVRVLSCAAKTVQVVVDGCLGGKSVASPADMLICLVATTFLRIDGFVEVRITDVKFPRVAPDDRTLGRVSHVIGNRDENWLGYERQMSSRRNVTYHICRVGLGDGR